MIVEASKIPPIHQRKFAIGRRAGDLRGAVMTGSLITCLRSAALNSGTRLAYLEIKLAHLFQPSRIAVATADLGRSSHAYHAQT